MNGEYRTDAPGGWLPPLKSVSVEEAIARRWPDPAEKIRKLIERDGLRCWICGRECDPRLSPSAHLFPTKDHVVRRADGGGNGMSNLKVACRKCNTSRHAEDYDPALHRGLNRKEKRERKAKAAANGAPD